MLATCICLNGSLLDQLYCTIVLLAQPVYLYIWSNKYVCQCLSVCSLLCVVYCVKKIKYSALYSFIQKLFVSATTFGSFHNNMKS